MRQRLRQNPERPSERQYNSQLASTRDMFDRLFHRFSVQLQDNNNYWQEEGRFYEATQSQQTTEAGSDDLDDDDDDLDEPAAPRQPHARAQSQLGEQDYTGHYVPREPSGRVRREPNPYRQLAPMPPEGRGRGGQERG